MQTVCSFLLLGAQGRAYVPGGSTAPRPSKDGQLMGIKLAHYTQSTDPAGLNLTEVSERTSASCSAQTCKGRCVTEQQKQKPHSLKHCPKHCSCRAKGSHCSPRVCKAREDPELSWQTGSSLASGAHGTPAKCHRCWPNP